jgi:hypothetical protein
LENGKLREKLKDALTRSRGLGTISGTTTIQEVIKPDENLIKERDHL